MKKLLLIFVLLQVYAISFAQPANSYVFTSSSGSYVPLTVETILWSGTFDNEVTTIATPSFKISDNEYTSITISSNGFITFGGTAPSATYYTPISGSTAYDAAVAGFGLRLNNAATGTPKVSYNTNVGGDIVIQWQDVKRQALTVAEQINFQIRLNTSTNEIKVVYGDCSTSYTSTSYAVQVGLRGNNYNIYNNRTTTTDWEASTAGTSRSATCRLNSTVLPVSGLTYTWTPPSACIAPTVQATNLQLTPASTSQTNGSFTAATGADSYLVVRTTDGTLSENPVDGTTYSGGNALGNGTVVQSDVATTFNATGLSNGVEYYFHVFAMNSQCTGGPLYFTNSPLSGSAYTLPNTPTSISATATGTSSIELSAVSTQPVLIAYNTTKTFGTPTGSYAPGDAITGGGEVLYIGDAATVPNHTVLNAGTTYYYRCWAVAGTSYSTSYREANATTVTVLPYIEGFESSTSSSVPVSGWLQDGAGSSWTVYNYGTIRTGTWRAAVVNTANKWMFRSLNLTGGQLYYVRFYALGSSSDPLVTSLSVAYGTSATAASMTEIILDEVAPNSADYGLIEGYFSPASSGTFFLGIKGFVSAFSYSISVDDVLVEEAMACPPPTMLTLVDTSSTSVVLSWTQFGNPEKWNLKYGEPGFDPSTQGTAINDITNSTQTISGLMSLTQYEVYMQAVCDGTPGAWSEPCVFTTTVDPLIGTYTIDQTQPASLTNFTSFNNFKSFLVEGGLGGAIVVNVVAENGPYNEQVIFNEVAGVSETNTITINGNGNTLEYLSTTNDQRATLKLDGAKWMVFNDLNIVALGAQSGEYGYAVQLMNNADNNSFIGCEISANESSTSNSFSALVASNSHTNNTSSGETATNLLVDQCVVSGGYYAVSLNGPTTTSIDMNITFTNNYVKDFYSRGISLSHQRNALVSGNRIYYSGTRSLVSTNMIYLSQNLSDTKITGNRIYGFAGNHSANQAINVYGVNTSSLSAASDRKILIANNLIYGFDKISGTHYGISLSGTNIRVLHNTISLDFVDYPGIGQQFGIYHTGSSANLEVVNNIVSIESNGTNMKYALYYATSGAVQNSNNNVIYMNTPNGSANYAGRYVSSNYVSLDDWQTTGFDLNSADDDPYFVDSGLLRPQNSEIDNMGADLLAIVPTDIEGTARTATPDPGAFEFEAQCMPPIDLQVSQVHNTAGTSARVAWTVQNGENQWEIEYGLSGFTLGEGTLIGVSTNPYTINGLSPNTSYDVYARAVCSESSGSNWAGPKTFDLCPAFDVPLSFNFDDVELDKMPECWNKNPQNTTGTRVSTEGYNSDNSLFILGSTQVPVLAVLPEINANLSQLYIHFFAKYISNSGLLEIGTVNSPDEPETFASIASVSLTTNYKYYQLLFDDYVGSHKYIALRSQGVRAFVDDLEVDLIPDCVQPTSLRASNIAPNEVGLMWDAGNDESKWELVYGNPGFDPDTEGTKIQNINQTSYTITGLIPGTRLEAYVRSDCGGSEYSEWSFPVAFVTACGALELPFLESFTDPLEPLCWVDDNDFWNLASEANFANGTPLYEAHFYGRSYTGLTRLIMPVLNTVGVQELKLTFKSKKRFFNYVDDAFIYVQTRLNNTWWISTAWEMDVKLGSNDEMLIEVPINNSLGGSTEIAFCVWGSHSVLTEWAIDDIQVTETTSCFTPINLDVSNISSNSAEIWWQQPGSENIWDIEYGPEGFTLGEGTLIEGLTANSYELSELEMASAYQVYVRASCGESQYSFWSEPMLFNTVCDSIYDLPFSETFVSSLMPNCWEEQVDDETQIDDFESWIVEAYDDAGGSPNQLALYNCYYNGISRLVLPRLNTSGIESVLFAFTTYINDDSKQLPLDFKLQKSYDGEIWSDVDGWSYNTENGEYSPQQVDVEINGISSDVLYLAFVVDGDHDNFYYWSIDNVEVTSNSSLPENLIVSTSLAASDIECFNALNQITVAGNGETVIIPATAEATFIAGQSIRFLPGFHAEVGSNVDAHITTSGEYCSFAPPAPIVQAEAVVEKSIVFDDYIDNGQETFAEKQITLYPNPNNGRFTLQLSNFDNCAQVMVVNLLGKVMHQATVSESDYIEIDMLNAPRGVYTVVVTDNETVKTSKMVVY